MSQSEAQEDVGDLPVRVSTVLVQTQAPLTHDAVFHSCSYCSWLHSETIKTPEISSSQPLNSMLFLSGKMKPHSDVCCEYFPALPHPAAALSVDQRPIARLMLRRSFFSLVRADA